MKLFTKTRTLLQTLALALLAAGVVSAQDAGLPPLGPTTPETPATPAPVKAGQETAESVNAFAFDLYREVIKGKDNVLFSPYSIASALGMTYAGADGETKEQMKRVLHFGDDVHGGFGVLNRALIPPVPRCGPPSSITPTFPIGGMADALNSDEATTPASAPKSSGKPSPEKPQPLKPKPSDKPGCDAEGHDPILRVANRLWPQEGFAIKPEFKAIAGKSYGAPITPLDFRADAEAAKDTINRWVAQKTTNRDGEPMIPELLEALSPETKLVLTNAIYFAGEWESQFDEDQTRDGAFFLADGSMVTTPMMNTDAATVRLSFDPESSARIVEIPYRGGDMSLVVAYGQDLSEIESKLTPANLEVALKNAREMKDHPLSMPKFKVESEFQLKDALEALGMVDLFSEADADLSGIAEAQGLHVSKVVHKAAASFDEKGAEAAAATAVVVVLESAMIGTRLDQPFLYMIRHTKSGTILFMGRMVDPTK
ncbi:MAG: serpin family protein [Planctomycetota bacterium]